MPKRDTPNASRAITISASPSRIIGAFFDPVALSAWWQVTRSVTIPRPLGPYVVEWDPTEFRDEVLGPLGGVFYGVVMEFKPGREFFLANAYWLPPEGEPIGPMALEVTCVLGSLEGDSAPVSGTRVKVAQRGFEDSVRWRRYYEVISSGWERALESLKNYLEAAGPRRE